MRLAFGIFIMLLQRDDPNRRVAMADFRKAVLPIHMSEPSILLLEAKSITKAFAGVQALKGVSFDLIEGEVHALLGENGAGKSTLIKIMTGAVKADSGALFVSGRPV